MKTRNHEPMCYDRKGSKKSAFVSALKYLVIHYLFKVSYICFLYSFDKYKYIHTVS